MSPQPSLRSTSAEPAQTVEAISASLEAFLADNPRAVVLEDAKVIFDMCEAKYSLATEHGRCTLHLWGEDRNVVRRAIGATLRTGLRKLTTHRFGPPNQQTLALSSDQAR